MPAPSYKVLHSVVGSYKAGDIVSASDLAQDQGVKDKKAPADIGFLLSVGAIEVAKPEEIKEADPEVSPDPEADPETEESSPEDETPDEETSDDETADAPKRPARRKRGR